jgi:mannose-6-phosphate isomerase-like protein (cupin superfamily)
VIARIYHFFIYLKIRFLVVCYLKIVKQEKIEKRFLPGRVIQLAVGDNNATSMSKTMTMGFAHYSDESGPMTPHRHAEEIVYVIDSNNGYFRFGGKDVVTDKLGSRVLLEPGMILHIPAQEWHVFEYDAGGSIEIIFFYGQADIYSDK